MIMKKFVLFIFGMLLFQQLSFGNYQDKMTVKLTLQEVIDLAQDSSLNAFINKNMYLADYWDYRTYKAEFLPKLNLSARPFTFTRAVNEEYNWQDSSYQYIKQQDLNSYFDLALTQNIPLTGGRIYLDSDVGRIQNFHNEKVQYSATPVRIGLRQELFGYNRFKWRKKIEPLKFKRAKRNYIQEREEIAERAVRYFFNLLLAQISYDISQTKYANADTLYKDGKQRFKKDSISQEDLNSLRLSKINALNGLEKTENWLRRAENSLISFLRLDKDIRIELVAPDDIPQCSIMTNEALKKARANNPEIIRYEQRRLQAAANVQRAKKSRFHADLNLSFGLNQSNNDIWNAYSDLLDQEKVRLSMNIPIIDWGLTQKRYNLAQKNKEVVDARMEQSEIEFDQDIRRTVDEFNLQKRIVRRAAQADTLARRTYEIVKKRFIKGEVDIVKLNSSEHSKISARKSYIQELEQYWEYYYEVRQLTLYDFLNDTTLSINFDKLTQENGLNPLFGGGDH